MDAETCLKKLSYVGVLSFATVDETGAPQIRCVSAIHYEPDAIYFFTARGKDFCRELQRDGRVQVLGYTKYKEMIRLSGVARAVSRAGAGALAICHFCRAALSLQCLSRGYPKHRDRLFASKTMSIEYFNLGVNPIFREIYSVRRGAVRPKGYFITDGCIRCGKCQSICPRALY